MKRSAAIAATILRRAFHAQPVAARRTTRIQTLHRPTGQILHSFASQNHGPDDGRKSVPPKRPDFKNAKNWRDCAPGALVSQDKSIQLVVVLLQSCGKYVERNAARLGKVSAWPGLATHCSSITPADEASARWKASLRADPLSSARRPLAAAWLPTQLFQHRCWRRHLCRRRSWACCSSSVNRD